ncbi:hypothetical protein LXL04_005434 [Taraxacum kok-saghyz]
MSKVQAITFFALTTLALIAISLPPKTEALIPYNRPLWDMMIPTNILEQNPLDHLPKNLETINLARADWKETSSHHEITLDVPGLKKEDIKIEVEESRVLKVSGERKAEEEVDGDKWHRAERTSGKFWRQFRLSGNVDMEKVMAHLEDGVLKIKVPKLAQEKKQSRVIDIMGGESFNGDIKATKTDM